MSFNFSLQSVSSSDFWLLPKPADVTTIDAIEATYSFESEITISYEKKEVSVVLATLAKPTEEYATYLLGITVKVVFNLHEMEQHVDKILQSIPDDLLNSLINVTLGSTRGILLERCRDTYFENTFLPLVNPAEVPRKSNESMVYDRIVKLYDEGNIKKSELVIDKAIELYPKNAIFYFAKAWFLQKTEQNSQKAIEYYEKAINLNPNIANFYNNCGNAYNSLNHYEKAVEYYKKAINLNPNDAGFHYNCGKIYINLGNYEKAIAYYENAISLDTNYISVYNDCGIAYDELGYHEKAIEYFEKAIALNPNNADFYNNCGIAYTNLKAYKKAVMYYEKALFINPSDVDILYNLACGNSLTKDKTTALSYLQKAIDLDINNKVKAQTDTDFEWLWDDADFKKITA